MWESAVVGELDTKRDGWTRHVPGRDGLLHHVGKEEDLRRVVHTEGERDLGVAPCLALPADGRVEVARQVAAQVAGGLGVLE